MNERWRQIHDILQKTVNPGLFQVWIKPLAAEFNGDKLTLLAPNEFVAGWVRDRLMGEIRQAATTALGRCPAITITTGARRQAGEARPPVGMPAAPPRIVCARENRDGDQMGLPIDPVLAKPAPAYDWRFSFDDFVVGPSNELAYAASRGLCQKTLASDQLFLSSGPGLGKTHLLQAVGQQLCSMSNRAGARVVYLSAEEFANQWVMALKSGKTSEFKARYREGVDVLLMEDVHFFQGKQKLQDELLATIKALGDRGAKAVFSSSFVPREIRDVDSQLASRFCSGFLAAIERPDFATRRRILEAKARVFQVQLPDEVADLLADRVPSDIRQLQSCLQNLVLKARLLNRAITMEMAWQVVGDYAASDARIGMDTVVDFICKSYGLSLGQLGSKSRRREVVLARNTAFFLARKHTELSLKDIGNRFNRRHSTVLKGITNVEREMSMETPLGRQLSRTIELISRFQDEQ